jgi:hypothetical protein
MWSDRLDLRAESHSIDLDEALGKSASSFCPLSASILLSPDKSFGSGEGVTTFQSHLPTVSTSRCKVAFGELSFCLLSE